MLTTRKPVLVKTMKSLLVPIIAVCCIGKATGFIASNARQSKRACCTLVHAVSDHNRRSILSGLATIPGLVVALPALADTGAEVRGTKLNAFNSLPFQYRGNTFGGLKAENLTEPSISYADFMERLKAGDVEFVEFVAPDGDAAYVTFKAKEGETRASPIRIGEGYPIEQHDGWSSPAFAIRAVKNAGVPYKFTVPGLAAAKARKILPSTI